MADKTNQSVSRWEDVSVGISVSHIQRHLAFLKDINTYKSLCESNVMLNAVRRYETMWLPLVADKETVSLLPPPDVHWAWHVHMLCPSAYEEDCRRLVAKIPDHEHQVLKSQIESNEARTKTLWEKRYPDEPYHVDLQNPEKIDTAKLSAFKCSLSYDVVSASKRQWSFYYHVSLSHFGDSVFLGKALERYKKFLFLKLQNPSAFLVPMYDIDLAWHTHQLHPAVYAKVCTTPGYQVS